MKKLFLILLTLLLAISLAVGSCGEEEPTPEEPTPTTGPTGTLRDTTAAWIETLDPNLQTTFEYALYEHLIGRDVAGNFVGELAESWSLSADGLTWTFDIREGVKFHNGDDFTSADAKFSIERIMEEGSMSPWIGEYSDTIASMETPDDYTLLIHCNFVTISSMPLSGDALWCPRITLRRMDQSISTSIL